MKFLFYFYWYCRELSLYWCFISAFIVSPDWIDVCICTTFVFVPASVSITENINYTTQGTDYWPNANIAWRQNWNLNDVLLVFVPSYIFFYSKFTHSTNRELHKRRHDDVIKLKLFPALLAICAVNSPVRSEFPAQGPMTQSFDVFFDLRLNKRLSKQSWGWWSETPPRSLWRQCNENITSDNSIAVGSKRQNAVVILFWAF